MLDLVDLQLNEHDEGCTLAVRVQPRAPKTALVGVHEGALKVMLQAPPVDGEANAALIGFLARTILRVPQNRVRILRGEGSKDKVVLLEGLAPSEALARIGMWNA